MKAKLFSIFIMSVLLVSCKQDIPDLQTYYVKNSAWETVDTKTVERAIVSLTLTEYVEQYNRENTDDQLFIMETDVPIEEAPDASAFICTIDTHEVILAFTGVPRTDFIERRETWRADTYANAGVLYIDHIPEVIVPPEPLPDYERYAVYLVNPAGDIVYETHCETWEADGYASMVAMFNERRAACAGDAYASGAGWQCISGHLYPVPIIPEV